MQTTYTCHSHNKKYHVPYLVVKLLEWKNQQYTLLHPCSWTLPFKLEIWEPIILFCRMIPSTTYIRKTGFSCQDISLNMWLTLSCLQTCMFKYCIITSIVIIIFPKQIKLQLFWKWLELRHAIEWLLCINDGGATSTSFFTWKNILHWY